MGMPEGMEGISTAFPFEFLYPVFKDLRQGFLADMGIRFLSRKEPVIRLSRLAALFPILMQDTFKTQRKFHLSRIPAFAYFF